MLNKKWGKLISVILAVLIIFALLPSFSVFAETEGLFKYTVTDGKATITGLVDTNTSGNIEIPDTIGGYSVTSIGAGAFYYCTGPTSITIPDSVTLIGNNAFTLCSGLTSITIPEGVTSIGNCAFQGCSALRSITIPEGVTTIGWAAFNGCTGLTSITIPDSVTSIDDFAFADCTGLTTVYYTGTEEQRNQIEIGSNNDNLINATWVYNYGENAETEIIDSGTCGDNLTWTLDSTGLLTISGTGDMYGYSYPNYSPWYSYRDTIKAVEFEGEIKSIGNRAFYDCSELTSITIPDSITSIGSSAFYGCTGLTSITIPNSVTSIGIGVFNYCKGLESITVDGGNKYYHSAGNCIIETASKTLVAGCKNSLIPNDASVTSIGVNAFAACSGLTSITIPDSVTSIGFGAFTGCSRLTSVTMGDSVTSIGDAAFSACLRLTSVTMGNSVTSIGDRAFSGGTGITSVTIPETVMEIGENAFPQSTVIYGYPSTAAETFAQSNGNVFIALPDLIDVFFVKKSNYFIGAKMEPNSVIIAAYFLSGEVKFYYKNFTVSGFDTETAGRKTVTVSYYGKTSTFSINVFEPTSDDLTTAIDMILGKESVDKKYDYTGDGNVNILDLIALKKQLANMD